MDCGRWLPRLSVLMSLMSPGIHAFVRSPTLGLADPNDGKNTAEWTVCPVVCVLVSCCSLLGRLAPML